MSNDVVQALFYREQIGDRTVEKQSKTSREYICVLCIKTPVVFVQLDATARKNGPPDYVIYRAKLFLIILIRQVFVLTIIHVSRSYLNIAPSAEII